MKGKWSGQIAARQRTRGTPQRGPGEEEERGTTQSCRWDSKGIGRSRTPRRRPGCSPSSSASAFGNVLAGDGDGGVSEGEVWMRGG